MKICREWGMTDIESLPWGTFFIFVLNFINYNVLMYFFICKVISAEKGHYYPEFRVGFYFFSAVNYFGYIIPVIVVTIE